jgi:curved DNA-binding protein CbpA
VFVASDPYATLGLDRRASDAEVRAAYRRLVQLHHPDHNGGSPESARRFEEVQEAYAAVREERSHGGGRADSTGRAGARSRPASPPPPDDDVARRLAEMERELRQEAAAARERVQRAAQEAAAAARAQDRPRATDEELGYVTTDDSFSKILGDFRDELFGRAEEVRDAHVRDRVADAIDDLASKLRKEPPKPD